MAKDLFSTLYKAGATLTGAHLKRMRGDWSPSPAEALTLPSHENPEADSEAVQTEAAPEVRRFSSSYQETLTFCLESRLAQFQFLSLPPAENDEIRSMVELELEKRKFLPLQLDQMTLSVELLSRSEEAVHVLVAAVRSDSLNPIPVEIGLPKAKFTRIDVGALAILRALRSNPSYSTLFSPGRHVLLLNEASSWTLLVLDHGSPLQIRTLGTTQTAPTTLLRLLRLSLLQADEDAGSPSPILSTTLLSPDPAPEFEAALRASPLGETLPPLASTDSPAALAAIGSAFRSAENSPFNLVPAAWLEELANHTHQRNLLHLIIGGLAIWAICAVALFFGPKLLDKAIASENAAVEALAPAVQSVNDVRHRVRLIQTYMDRTHAPLEILREVCLLLPQGITLNNLRFHRKDARLIVNASATSTALVYEFKQNIDGSALFAGSQLTSGPTTNTRTGGAEFELTALLNVPPDEEGESAQ